MGQQIFLLIAQKLEDLAQFIRLLVRKMDTGRCIALKIEPLLH